MSLKEELSKLQNELDLNKKYPGYFNKRIFQSVVVICLLLLCFIILENDVSVQYVYIECLEDICLNPLRTCEHIPGEWYTPGENCIEPPAPDYIIELCGGVCPEYLTRGEIIGTKPPFYARYFNGICMLLMLFSFVLNDLLYRIKRRRG